MSETHVAETTTDAFTLDGLSHITLPARNAQEAKRFWVSLFGAGIEVDHAGFIEVNIGGTVLGYSENSDLIGPRGTEAPHFAFYIKPERLLSAKAHLEAHGVPTQPLWTRSGKMAHMYFCDPSANLFELIAVGFEDAHSLPRPPSNDGDMQFDLSTLAYEWRG